MPARTLPVALLIVATSVTPTLAQPVVTELGAGNIVPTGISDDSSVIAGYAFTNSFHAVRWTAADGLQTLSPINGASYDIVAHGLSGDGTVVVGSRRTLVTPDLVQPVYWINGGDIQFLPMQGSTAGYAGAASAHGVIIVGGCGTNAWEPRAVRWVGGSMNLLGTLKGHTISRALDVSADGAIVYGYCGNPPTLDAFRWTAGEGMVPIPMPEGTTLSGIGSTNTAGTLLVGDARTVASGRAVGFIWRPGEGSRVIASPEGLNFFAHGTNDAATLICGSTLIGADHHAAVWTSEGGVVLLEDYLEGLGAPAEGWSFRIANAVSRDGSSITGTGTHNGTPAAFLITGLPVGCRADFDGDGVLNSQDFFEYLAAFFAQSPSADFNRDGTVNSQDFFSYLVDFFAGC